MANPLMLGRYLFFVYIVTSITLGYYLPVMPVLKPTIPWLLGLSLYFYFLYISLRGNLKPHLPILLKSAIYRFIIMPLLIYLLFRNYFSPVILVGTLIMAAAPTALGSVLIIERSGIKTPIVALDIITQNMLAVIVLPLISLFLLNTRVGISGLWLLSIRLFSMIVIPYIAARLSRRITPEWNWERWRPFFANLNGITIIFIIFVATNLAFAQIKHSNQHLLYPFLGMALLCIFNYGIGFLLGLRPQRGVRPQQGIQSRQGMPNHHPLPVSVLFGYRNTSLIVWITLNFFSPESSIFPVFYIIVQHILNAGLLAWNSPPPPEKI